jgi:mRNA interferase RelE/StbE
VISFRIEFRPRAVRDLKALPKAARSRIVSKITSLGSDPYPQEARKLTGEKDLYRIRVSDYRVIYQARHEVLLVLVVRVGHRKDIYRKASRERSP